MGFDAVRKPCASRACQLKLEVYTVNVTELILNATALALKLHQILRLAQFPVPEKLGQ